MKELVEEIAKALVDHPDGVQVRAVEGEQVTVLELRVHPEDLGKSNRPARPDGQIHSHHPGSSRHENAEALHAGNPRVVPPEPFAALTLARVLRPWGRRGEVAAEILTDFPERLRALRRVWLAGGRIGSSREAMVVSCRLHNGQAVFHFDGVSSIDDAEKLRGLEIQVPFSERVSLPSGRYYISDLIGCEVWEEGAAAALGVVRQVQPLAESGATAAQAWVLAVDMAQAGELLIPLATEICIAIDIAARRIVVRLPAGLLELNG